jgi:hypothetical protein
VKIARAAERLANDMRADDLAILHNQLAVGFAGKDHLRDARHHQRIDNP